MSVLFFAGFYAHVAWNFVWRHWLGLAVATLLIVAIFLAADDRSRKALDTDPPTTYACYEDNFNCTRWADPTIP